MWPLGRKKKAAEEQPLDSLASLEAKSEGDLDGASEGTLDGAATEVLDTADADAAVPKNSRSQGWGRLLQGNKVIWVVSAVAVVSLVAGLALGRFIVSPGQAAADADPPAAGLITVPVEEKVLANDITIRGDANYADSVEVKIETGDIGGPAIVTGQVPAVGATFTPGSIALEVTGRPVIVLPGDLPVYRTLRVGVSGPDVLQLKQALNAIGIGAGDLGSPIFDAAAAAGVQALYDRVGYPAPSSPEGTAESVRSANDGVRSAQDGVAAAQRALAQVQSGASQVDRVEQDNLVRSAERALAAAKLEDPQDLDKIADLEDAVTLAKTRRDSVLAPRDSSEAQANLNSANQQLSAARELLAEARKGTLTFLPSSEVLYLPGLPRRVDEVTVQRGTTIQGAVMRVSGATLVIKASAAESDAKLLKEGDKATLAMPDGSEHGATITSVTAAKSTSGSSESGRYEVLLTPDELTPEQLQVLQGNNVRVKVPVSSTEGKVLAVPLAALTAGAGGESRVEVSTGTKDETTLVEVTTGLAAGGFVEVSAVDGSLKPGDLVVVGR